MKIQGYMDLTLEEVKKILADYATSQGFEPTAVNFPEVINSNSTISIDINVKPQPKSQSGGGFLSA